MDSYIDLQGGLHGGGDDVQNWLRVNTDDEDQQYQRREYADFAFIQIAEEFLASDD